MTAPRVDCCGRLFNAMTAEHCRFIKENANTVGVFRYHRSFEICRGYSVLLQTDGSKLLAVSEVLRKLGLLHAMRIGRCCSWRVYPESNVKTTRNMNTVGLFYFAGLR